MNTPLIKNDPNVIFYKNGPVKSVDGYSLETISVIGNQSKEKNPNKKVALLLLLK